LPKVDVSINGRFYAVACDEGQEARVRELAGIMDSRVRRLSGGGSLSGVAESHALVLAGLMLADELSESNAALEEHAAAKAAPATEIDEDLLVVTIDHLADRIAVIADRLDRA
jgi:cell division protein ZapA